ncbi:MAG: hypothetical protein QXM07_07100, partial [Nitrososphaerota archaeon]
ICKETLYIKKNTLYIEIIESEIFPYQFRDRTIIVYFKNLKEIEYNSISRNSKLKWIRINNIARRLIGIASFRD